jgi:hypothetical protein
VNIKGSNNDEFYGMRGRRDDPDDQHVTSSAVITRHLGVKMSLITNTVIAGPSGYMVQLNGIYGLQEFYPADISKAKPSEAEYLSTLYWKHLIKISSLNTAVFSFYTGDITGRFKIVVQGITGNDVTYGETTFNVIKPK